MLGCYEQQYEDEDGGGGLGHSTVQYSTVQYSTSHLGHGLPAPWQQEPARPARDEARLGEEPDEDQEQAVGQHRGLLEGDGSEGCVLGPQEHRHVGVAGVLLPAAAAGPREEQQQPEEGQYLETV